MSPPLHGNREPHRIIMFKNIMSHCMSINHALKLLHGCERGSHFPPCSPPMPTVTRTHEKSNESKWVEIFCLDGAFEANTDTDTHTHTHTHTQTNKHTSKCTHIVSHALSQSTILQIRLPQNTNSANMASTNNKVQLLQSTTFTKPKCYKYLASRRLWGGMRGFQWGSSWGCTGPFWNHLGPMLSLVSLEHIWNHVGR